MIFTEVLRDITEGVKGATGAAVVGMDGIIVEQYPGNGGVDLQSIGAEFGNILKVAQVASDSLELGSTSEMTVGTDSGSVILRKINDEYFLALVMSGGGNFGKGRFMARTAVKRLEKEF